MANVLVTEEGSVVENDAAFFFKDFFQQFVYSLSIYLLKFCTLKLRNRRDLVEKVGKNTCLREP